MKKGLLLIICLVIFSGCTYHLKPDKYQTYQENMRSFSSNNSISIIVPKNAEKEYMVESPNLWRPGLIAVNLNDIYKNIDELIREVLEQNKVSVSEGSTKYLKFTIDRIQRENWAMGFVKGAYFDFTIETSTGYKKQYRVQDGSASQTGFFAWSDAIGGCAARAVEKIFQDENIIKFIETSN